MTAPIPERHPDRSTRTEEAMSEPAARKRLREAREQAKAERAEAVYDIRLTHRSLPDRAEHLAEELRKVLVDNGAVPSVARFQGAAVMVGLQVLAVDLAICERRAREVEAERDRVKAELNTRIAAESADAAAGNYAGRAEEAEAARDAVQAEATLLRRALIGRRTFPVGVMRTPMDERTEAIRARWDEFCFSGPSETDRERDQVIGWLLDRMDSATARAEKAEAELKRLAEVATRSVADLNPDDEWDEIEQLTELLAAATNRAEQAEAALAEMRERLTCGDHCADVERERDECRIELEQFRHEKAEQEARRAERKPVSIGTGMPGTSHLEAFGQYLRDAFGTTPYHVGSSIHGKTWRDVDVRVMLDDDRFDALFPGYASRGQRDAWWSLLCAALSVLGEQRTGLPIDCQVQRTSDANEKYPGARNPLFVGLAEDDHRPTFLTQGATATATRPADGSAGTGKGQRTDTPAREAQRGSQGRSEFESFLTDDGRRAVAEFFAEAAQDSDDNLDIDAVIAQNHADTMRDWFGEEGPTP